MKWLQAIAAVAPTIARAIPGPIGMVARTLLGDTLKVDAHDDAALEAKVQTLTAADLLALKNAEQKFIADMKALDLDVFKLDAEDRANARAREVALRDWLPKALAIFVLTLYGVDSVWLHLGDMPAANREAAMQVQVTLQAAVMLVLSYYFGSSSGSRAKDATVASMSAAIDKQ